MKTTTRILLALGLTTAATGALVSPAGALLLNSSGPVDFVASGPPNYDNCTMCHNTTGEVNSGSGEITVDGFPSEYTPGTTYPVTVTVSDPSASRWGFELTTVDGSGNSAGTLVVTDSVNTQLTSSFGRDFMKHTLTGTADGTVVSNSWSFEWIAPSSGTGTVKFYASGNAANSDDTTTGDFIYNCATASRESGATGPDATLIMQPRTIFVSRGSTWTVDTRVRDHLGSTWTPVFVSNVTLPNGSTFPGTNEFLENPIDHPLTADSLAKDSISHFIPNSAPVGSYTYNGFIGLVPNTLVDSESFAFSIL